VREDPLAVDSTFLEPAYGALEKCSGARCVLRGEHLGIRQARVVVDADEDDFPTNTPSLAAPISMDRMPDPLDPSELLGVDVKQASRVGVLVALRRGLGFVEPPQSPQSQRLEMPRHRGDRDPELLRDLPACLPSSPQLFHSAQRLTGRSHRDPVGSRAAVLQARDPFGSEAMEPLVQGLSADLSAGRDLSNRSPLLQDKTDQSLSARRSQLRVRMESHSGISSGEWWLALQPHRSSEDPRVNNLLRHQT